MAQGQLTAGTKLAMQPSHVQAIRATSGQRASLRAFITVSDPAAVQRLRQLGVRVHMCFGHMVTATVPLSLVGSVCRMAGVRQLAVAQLSQLCNDSAMADAHVVPVAVGTGFNIPYTGRDVVVGVIDTGVDFNHINLCDSMGRSRVVAAYLPQDSTGTSPVIHGDTLPGSHYNTPEQIALLTTDDPTASHGTSPLCQVFDQISGPGRILSVSAHNSGYAALHLNHNFATGADTVSTTLDLYSGSFNNTVSFWSSQGHRHKVALTLIDKKDRRLVLETPYFVGLDPDSVLTVDMDSDTLWSQYVTGTMQFATAVELDDRAHSILVSHVKPRDTGRYRLGLKVVADEDPSFHAWVNGGVFFRGLLPGQVAGTKAGTISDLATGEKAISVGAYITKQVFPLASGGTFVSPRATPMHDIAYFTAWGPDTRGKSRPDICAPGMVTVSSASRYDAVSPIVNASNLSFFQNSEGIDYPYGACYGTSMSAPVMTGAIALWLQAKSDLSPDDIRDILDHTAVRDQWVTQGEARCWGRGKLDVEAGMHYLLRSLNRLDVNADGVLDVADVNVVINAMLGRVESDELLAASDVTDDGKADVADINVLINAMLGK